MRSPFIKQLYDKVACEHRSGRYLYEWIHEQGFVSRGGNWYQGDYEPLVSQQMFDDVQRALERPPFPEWGATEFAFTWLLLCGTCGSGITADEKKKQLMDESISRHVYFRCTHTRNRQCTEPPIKEGPLIEQLIELLDGLDLNASAVKRKIDDEFERFSKFATDVLGIRTNRRRRRSIRGSMWNTC